MPIIQTSEATELPASVMPSTLALFLSDRWCGELRARLWRNEIEATGLGVIAGLISVDEAVEHLADVGALTLISSKWW